MILNDLDFKNCVDYTNSLHFSCHEVGCDSICRCSQIVDFKITGVNISKMVEVIYDELFDDSKSNQRNQLINSILYDFGTEIDKYTIDRCLRINKIFTGDKFIPLIVSGYYGEEIGEITLNKKVSDKLDSDLKRLFSIDDLNLRILELVKMEYGKILPELIGSKFEEIEVERDKVLFGSQSQFKRVQAENLEHYSDKNYNLIRGLVIQRGDEFRLIDGYHRVFASEMKLIKVICKKY